MSNNLIYKSNDIIEASYHLTLNEQRLLLACISQVKSDGAIGDRYVISVEQARDLFYDNKGKDKAFRDLKAASKKLWDRGIHMKSESGQRELFTRWVSTVEFDNEEQTATLYFHDQIKPYIAQLKSNFTKYRLSHITQLTSVYAIRIYELIVSWYSQNQPYKEYKIDDFKELLQIGDKYSQFGEFKSRVITPALKQINAHTDFEFEISYRKVGRSFKYIQLRFNRKPEFELAESINQKKMQHNLSKAEQKSRAIEKQRKKAAFTEYAKDIFIAKGMTFENIETGAIYTVDENNSIMTNDFNELNKYFITDDHMKYLLFLNRIRQINNLDDSDTKTFNF
ncbi:replication initiation protein [Ostreibacterium oceani]|nr:replication initiation protein [Ostreibacterium oceani]